MSLIESLGTSCLAQYDVFVPHNPPSELHRTANRQLWQLCGRALPNGPLQTALVSSPSFTVGRQTDCTMCLANPTVSKRHAELAVVDERLLVRDLGSRNGTFLNGRRVGDWTEVRHADRLQFGTALFTAQRASSPPSMATLSEDVAGMAEACMLFDRLVSQPAVVPHYQPIVRLNGWDCIGYEVLARSHLAGLETPAQMFRVASELGAEVELSALMRREGLRAGLELAAGAKLFLNTHPNELGDPRLADSLAVLRAEFPNVPVVLEVHEAAAASLSVLAALRVRCRELNMELAYDDFGAGQSRLLELAEVPPDIIKFDMHMTRGIDRFCQQRRQMIESLVRIVRSLGAVPLAEGIETVDEAAACLEAGFELGQGFFFGFPSPAHAWKQARPDPA
jgi:EAL domain-containing protein (putative c-di-GMP-specific phosphodiesterase class I)